MQQGSRDEVVQMRCKCINARAVKNLREALLSPLIEMFDP
jgi:hypothetical protein